MPHLSRSQSAPSSVSETDTLINELLDFVQREKTAPQSAGPDPSPSSSISTAEYQPGLCLQLTIREWFDLSRQFLLNNLYSLHKPHCYCSESCSFFQYSENVFVCTTSGNLHFCSALTCDSLDNTGCVCTITGITYSLVMLAHDEHKDHDHELTQRALKKKQKQNTKTVEQARRDTEIKEAVKSLKRKKPEASQEEVKEEVKQQFGYKRREVLFDRSTKFTEALNIVNQILSKAKGDPEFNPVRLTHEILDSWQLAQHFLQLDKQERSAYSFQDHCLAALYTIKSGGFKDEGKNEQILSYDSVVTKYLPLKKKLKSDKFLKGRTGRVTTAIRILTTHLMEPKKKKPLNSI